MKSLCTGSWKTLADARRHSVALLWAGLVGLVGCKAFAGGGVRIELVLGRHLGVLAFLIDERRRRLASASW